MQVIIPTKKHSTKEQPTLKENHFDLDLNRFSQYKKVNKEDKNQNIIKLESMDNIESQNFFDEEDSIEEVDVVNTQNTIRKIGKDS